MHLILSSTVNDPPGGISQFCIYLCDFFKKKNIPFKIYYIGNTPLKGYEKESCYFDVRQGPRWVIFSAKLMLEMAKGRVHFDRNDTVIVNRIEVAAVLFPLMRCQKKIQFIHGSSAYANIFWSKWIVPFYNLFERIAIFLSTKTVILLKNKKYGLPYYQGKYPKFKSKLVYSPLPVGESFLNVGKRTVREDKCIIIGYHGRLEHNPKRILDYLDVLDYLLKIGVQTKLHFIGFGDDVKAIQDKAKALNVENEVFLLGGLSGDKLAKAIEGFDVFLLLSRFEGICLSALEAAALRIPVVSTKVGDVEEYVKSDNNGYLVNVDYSIEEVAVAVMNASKLQVSNNAYIDTHYSLSYFEETMHNTLGLSPL